MCGHFDASPWQVRRTVRCPDRTRGQTTNDSDSGESIFRNDLCNADVALGDLLVHDGAAAEAERHAARVFGADRTYFVLNGTSTNTVVTNAVLRPGDPVLFDSGDLARSRVSAARTHRTSVSYLRAIAHWDRRFRGFGHDTHGVENRDGASYVQCLTIEASPRTVSA